MLTLTDGAADIVKEITNRPEVPDDAGLRITADDPAGGQLNVTAAPAAEPGDATVEQSGATVFLDAGAAELLDDKVLDAGVDQSGNVSFTVGEQATPQA